MAVLRAAFPNYPEKPKQSKKGNKVSSSKTPKELQAIFDDLVTRTQNGGGSAFTAKIDEFTDEDIIALAVEVGVGSPSKLSRRKATDGIRMRVQEAMQLQFEKKTPNNALH